MTALVPESHLDMVCSTLAQMPQVDLPVEHFFSEGLYTRVLRIAAGTMLLGHHHKYEHMNICLQGKLALFCDDGTTRIVSAPMMMAAKPGRKFAYAIEDTAWANVFPNIDNERDIEKLEARYLDLSLIPEIHLPKDRPDDREDYQAFLLENGFTESYVQSWVQRKDDIIAMPDIYACKLSLRPSGIEGIGMFASAPVAVGDVIAPARIGLKRTPAGRFINHAKDPNCVFEITANNDINTVAIKPIRGCRGGDYGEEITVNYRQALAVQQILEGILKCQQ